MIDWMENHNGEPYHILAVKIDNKWKFSQRLAWEVQWYEAKSTPERIAKAEELLKAMAPKT